MFVSFLGDSRVVTRIVVLLYKLTRIFDFRGMTGIEAIKCQSRRQNKRFWLTVKCNTKHTYRETVPISRHYPFRSGDVNKGRSSSSSFAYISSMASFLHDLLLLVYSRTFSSCSYGHGVLWDTLKRFLDEFGNVRAFHM